MRKIILILLLICALFFKGMAFCEDLLWQEIGDANLKATALLIHPENNDLIYFASAGTILKAEDSGKSYRTLLLIKGQDPKVNFLVFDSQDKKQIYAATSQGLFYSSNAGLNWRKVFKGKNSLEKDCQAVLALDGRIYLGTGSGLFISRDKGRSWYKEKSSLSQKSILAIDYNHKNPEYIYIVSDSGLFKSKDRGESWQEVYLALAIESECQEDNYEEDIREEEDKPALKYIYCQKNNIYLATSQGVFKSSDEGDSWQLISSYGLLSKDIKFLLVNEKEDIYAVAANAIFLYRNQRWQELSLRLIADEINSLALDDEDSLYAACDSGLFKAESTDREVSTKDHLFSLYSKNEPAILEVQQAAIKYAEVDPQKIINWRKQAARKAILPELSIGLDRNVTDLWHWEGGSTTREGDDILTRGRDAIEWDVSLKWDLGELIWNDDQTSIDVRSKLMVQLRDDIVDSVTRLYFERLRVKYEIDNLSIIDRKKLIDKEIRLEELTALIDAATGGYFSRNCK
ncbi:MAG: hypothetical protein DRP74_04950 [Candidatus Omnitrophota bacterium]|nr:MAG: hypothetical protein DRP74_04950 [Candidatus Omnitrophota bacterium]